jgi:hypothetical protein
MPFAIAEPSLPDEILVTVSGEVSAKEMQQFMIDHRGGPERSSAFLFDISNAAMSVSADDVLMVASRGAREARTSPMGPVAFISTSPGPFGMARMFQSFSAAEGRPTVGVFRSLDEARAWVRNLPQKDGSR